MVGNLGEWTDEWYGSVGFADAPATGGARVYGRRTNSVMTTEPQGGYPTGYGDDVTSNFTSVVYRYAGEDNMVGLPGAAIRGGNFGSRATAGVYTIDLAFGPTYKNGDIGFRCVIPR